MYSQPQAGCYFPFPCIAQFNRYSSSECSGGQSQTGQEWTLTVLLEDILMSWHDGPSLTATNCGQWRLGATHSWWMWTDTWHACLISSMYALHTHTHISIIFSKKAHWTLSFPCKIISNKLYLFTNWVWNCHLFNTYNKKTSLKDSNGLPRVCQLPSLHITCFQQMIAV